VETIDEARAVLRANIDKGMKCPCCTQMVKMYRRPMSAGMAVALIAIHRAAPAGAWVDVKTIDVRGGDYAKLRYWGLLEMYPQTPDQATRHAGLWRVTDKGRLFVTGALSVPKYARVFDERPKGLVGSPVDIKQALGTKFNYQELMGC